jgi:hypothetical protein
MNELKVRLPMKGWLISLAVFKILTDHFVEMKVKIGSVELSEEGVGDHLFAR